MPLLSAIAIVMCYGGGEEGSGRGAIAGCHSSVDQFWGGAIAGCPSNVLWSGRGAIAGCHCSVLWCGEGVVDVVPSLGAIAIAICHCNVLWWGKRVTTIFERVDVVPSLGAIAGCQSLFHMFLLFSRPPISPRHTKKRQ